MNRRNFSFTDRLLGEIDNVIKVLNVPAHARRAAPEVSESTLAPRERLNSARLMRVNHAGEIAAQALYQGQALGARDAGVKSAMRESAAEELDHLAWCGRRLKELNGRTSLLNPLWYAGSFAIGSLAGALGDRISLGFVAETEKQVEAHLGSHLQRLAPEDARSRAIVEQMRHDEARHGEKAAAMGGEELPNPVRFVMRATSRLMTYASYWI